MKKLVTIVIFLLTFNCVSAKSPGPLVGGVPSRQVVVTVFSPVLSSDSATILVSFTDKYYFTDTLRPRYSVNHADSLKILTALYSMVSPKLPEVLQSHYIPGLSPITNLADSLGFLAFKYGTINSKLLTALRQNDSLRTISHIDDLKLLASSYGLVNSNLAAVIDQQDSLRVIEAARIVNLRKQLKYMDLDSLKRQLKTNKYESLKLPLYTEIASRYLNYDTISNKRVRLNYENEAIAYTMMALHKYSRHNDTLGLRTSFNNLAKVYFDQNKYTQAKWFILQSNNISRIKKDTLNIISSLLTLSAIKSEIKDYSLAMRDLNDALRLSRKSHLPKLESGALINYALLYSRMKNYPKEAAMLKKRDSVEEKIRKDDEARLVARVATLDSLHANALDSLQSKKKVYTFIIEKLYKSKSSRKIASL